MIRRMGARKAIIFSTHILEEVDAACTRAIIIDRGRIVANGTPEELRHKSEQSGAVLLCVSGQPSGAVSERLNHLSSARRTTIVKEENGKVWARVYSKSKNTDGELARNVMQAAQGWSVEELHTEEGRLDDVFRSITLSETAKEVSK